MDIDTASQVIQHLGLIDGVSFLLISPILANSFSLWFNLLTAHKRLHLLACPLGEDLSLMTLQRIRKLAFRTSAIRKRLTSSKAPIPRVVSEMQLLRGEALLGFVLGTGLFLSYRVHSSELICWDSYTASRVGTVVVPHMIAAELVPTSESPGITLYAIPSGKINPDTLRVVRIDYSDRSSINMDEMVILRLDWLVLGYGRILVTSGIHHSTLFVHASDSQHFFFASIKLEDVQDLETRALKLRIIPSEAPPYRFHTVATAGKVYCLWTDHSLAHSIHYSFIPLESAAKNPVLSSSNTLDKLAEQFLTLETASAHSHGLTLLCSQGRKSLTYCSVHLNVDTSTGQLQSAIPMAFQPDEIWSTSSISEDRSAQGAAIQVYDIDIPHDSRPGKLFVLGLIRLDEELGWVKHYFDMDHIPQTRVYSLQIRADLHLGMLMWTSIDGETHVVSYV